MSNENIQKLTGIWGFFSRLMLHLIGFAAILIHAISLVFFLLWIDSQNTIEELLGYSSDAPIVTSFFFYMVAWAALKRMRTAIEENPESVFALGLGKNLITAGSLFLFFLPVIFMFFIIESGNISGIQLTDFKVAILLCVGFIFIIFALHAGLSFAESARLKPSRRFSRPSSGSGRGTLIQHVILALLLAWILYDTPLIASRLGIKTDYPPLLAFAIGFIIYLGFRKLLSLLTVKFGLEQRTSTANFFAMRATWPRRGPDEWKMVVAVCILNPFTEEIVMRGILVSLLGESIGNIGLAILIAFACSTLLHVYQGAGVTVFHMCFNVLAILILLSPLGLLACFGFHLAGDLIPVINLKKNMKIWMRNRRYMN